MVEVPVVHSVTSTLLSIGTQMFILGSPVDTGGGDVVVNAGLDARRCVGLRPPHALVTLVATSVVGGVGVVGDTRIGCGALRAREIEDL